MSRPNHINPYCGNCGRDLLACRCPMPIERWPAVQEPSNPFIPAEPEKQQDQKTQQQEQDKTCQS